MKMPRKTEDELEVGARIRAHLRREMKQRGIDAAELARKIEADDGNIYRILDGSRLPGLGQILRICRGLKINPTMLLEEDPPQEFWDRPTDKG